MEFDSRLPEDNVNVSHEAPFKEFIILISGMLALVMGVYFALGFMVDYAIPYIPPEQEKAFSEMIEWEQPDSGKFVEETKYLQEIVDDLQERCVSLPFPIHVHIIDTEDVNAAALPGGTILVYAGLLKQTRSENELTFVLGHELGHFKNRDHLKGMGRAVVLLAMSILFLGSDSGMGEMILNSVEFVNVRFSQNQELEADKVGLHANQCRYGHVTGSGDFFEKLVEGESNSVFANFLASHPNSATRIKKIKTLAQQSGYAQGSLTQLKFEWQVS